METVVSNRGSSLSARSRLTPTAGEDNESFKGEEVRRQKPLLSQLRTPLRSAVTYLLSHRNAAVGGTLAALVILVLILIGLSGKPGGGSGVRHRYLRGGKHKGGLVAQCEGRRKGEKIKPFIYVYDFGGQFTDSVRRATPAWYSSVYDAEKVFLDHILGTSAVRTWAPEAASLFYVPFFAAYFLSCQYRDWENNMREAVMRTSEVWEAVLSKVRAEYPFFNRTNGRDHFSVLSIDYGRCQSLTYVDPGLYGDMFFLTPNGDKMLRSTHTHAKRSMQVLAYNYGSHTSSDIPDIPCFRSDLDIVIPPTLEESDKHLIPITSPFVGERSITALFRFSTAHHHKQPVLHSNHDIRKELYDMYEKRGLEGWDFGVKEPEKIMREDMQKSVFCVCPPGHSQWTARLAKSVLSGCIPVTFFRDHENPWEKEIDYTAFSVNVDPDALLTLYERLEKILRNPRKLIAMQRNLEQVQKLFQWDEKSATGAQAHLVEELWCRAREIEHSAIGRLRDELHHAQKHKKGRKGRLL